MLSTNPLAIILQANAAPKFDWKAIATKMGHADAKKARDAWYGVRDKLAATVSGDEKKSIDLASAQKELFRFVIETMSASVGRFVVVFPFLRVELMWW